GGGVRQRRGFEVFRDEQFVHNLLVYGLWNLVTGGVVLLYKETALLWLSEVPDIEDGKSVEQVFEPWTKMRILVGGVQRAKRWVSFLPLVRKIDGPRINNQVAVEIDVCGRFLRQEEPERIATLGKMSLEPRAEGRLDVVKMLREHDESQTTIPTVRSLVL